MNSYIINLKYRKDRYNHIMEEVKKLPFVVPHVIEACESEVRWEACFNSHKKCIGQAKDSNLDSILILEDDAVFTNDSFKTLKKALEEIKYLDWDMLFLGANLQSEATNVSKHLIKITGAFAAHAYIVNKKMYDTILNFQYNKEIDVCYDKLMKTHNIFMCNPIIAYQLPSYSDIEKGYRDYNSAISANFLKHVK